MDDCLRLLSEGRETPLDIVLSTQVKCQIITYQLTRPSANGLAGGESSKAPSAMLTAALLRQLGDVRQGLPAQLVSDSQDPNPLIAKQNLTYFQGIRNSICTIPKLRLKNLYSVNQRHQTRPACLTSTGCKTWMEPLAPSSAG